MEKNADWYPAFESELLRFPRDRHDDQVDAFAYLGLLLDKMHDAPTTKEIEQMDFEEEMETSDMNHEGINPICGY
jgi:hypothetical protein